MLQRMQTEISEFLRFGMREDGNHSAFVVEFVEGHLAPGLHLYLTAKLVFLFWWNKNSQTVAIATESVLKEDSSAFSYAADNSETAADTAGRPSTEISSPPSIVSPRVSAVILYFRAICWIRETLFGSHETKIRLASSPKSTNSTGSPPEARFTRAPIFFGKAFSARATASPPSAQSCAESTISCRINSTMAFCSVASFSRSSSGG